MAAGYPRDHKQSLHQYPHAFNRIWYGDLLVITSTLLVQDAIGLFGSKKESAT